MSTYLNLKPVEFDKLSAKRKAAVKWEGRILLPKYDGVLGMVGFWNGVPEWVLSRDGNESKSMGHIFDDLVMVYPWIQHMKGGLCVLGEVWNPGVQFKDISGAFRRQRPQGQLGFAPFDTVAYVYDAAEAPVLSSHVPYADRLAYLTDHRTPTGLVYPPKPITCENEDHAWRYANNLKSLGGYDGAIASDPHAAYHVSDGVGEFLKLKPLQSFTLAVVGVEADVGEKTGRATVALKVRFKDRVGKVGTGFSNADAAAWAADPSLVVGRLAEVSCMGVYPGDDGMMREPRFVGFRDDVTTPDF